jgi:hypothetical protein
MERMMAITIRNKTTEEMIRKLGRRTGEGPSAVIRRAVEAQLNDPEKAVDADEIARRRKLFAEIQQRLGPKPNERLSPEENRRAQQEIFDYLDQDAAS